MIAAPEDVITPRDREVAAIFERMHELQLNGIRIQQVAQTMEDCGYVVDTLEVCKEFDAIEAETARMEARLHELVDSPPSVEKTDA